LLRKAFFTVIENLKELGVDNFLLETYSLPRNFIEMEKDFNMKDTSHHFKKIDKVTNWVIYKPTTNQIIETVSGDQKKNLLEFYRYKKHFPLTVIRNMGGDKAMMLSVPGPKAQFERRNTLSPNKKGSLTTRFDPSKDNEKK
jgi:hypothetical protein